MRSLAAFAVVVTLVVCSGCGGQNREPASRTDAFCKPAKAHGAAALTDDRGAIPANNVVPVATTTGQFRTVLALTATISRAISPADVEKVARATNATRAKAVSAALADLDGLPAKSRVKTMTVGVPADRSAGAVAALYAAALLRADVAVTTRRVADASTALRELGAGRIGLVPLALGSVAKAVGAPAGPGELQARLQAVSTAAMKHKVVIGAPTQVADQPVLALSPSVASSLSVHTIAGLIELCGRKGLVIGATAKAHDAATAFTRTYGSPVTPLKGTSALAALESGQVTAVLVTAKELAMTRR
ncbi:hypothetical protein [Kribbella deserti]|uniref:ABC transporter substrate-binding protein n=1 Tax=Kribbella deserti TaxID=1926257 RepID=A0ABV6QWD8_9ACTN